jgi:hypothetical protein
MKNNRTTRFFILFLVMQTIAITALVVGSWQVVVMSQKIMQRDDIRMVKTLTESYAVTAKSISDTYQQSQEVVPEVRDALKQMQKKLKSILKKLPGTKKLRKEIESALLKTITTLDTYETKTQPAMLKSLQKTEKTLQKLSEQLVEEQSGIQYLPWYIAGILASIVIILFFNSLFLVYIYKQQPAKG